VGKKDVKNTKKTNGKRWNLWRILDFTCLYSFRKMFHDFL